MSRPLPSPICWETALSGVAVALGLAWCIGTANYRAVQAGVFVLFVLGLALGMAVLRDWRFAPWGALVYASAVGIANRVGRSAFNGSDVIGTTGEAINLVAHGRNPYAHTFVYSNPPGSPFPYLPGEIAWYALVQRFTGQVIGTDKIAGIGIVLVLATLGLVAGPGWAALSTMLYATFEAAVLRSLDGSNDTSLAFLTVLAVALLAASERLRSRTLLYAGAAACAWTITFKPFAWLIYPFVVQYLRGRSAPWRSFLAVSLGLSGLVVLPFFVTAPGGLIHNIAAGLSFHRRASGLDLWSALRGVPGVDSAVQIAPGLAVGAIAVSGFFLLRRPASTLGSALFRGSAVVCVGLLLARYATSSYYTYVFALLAAGIILWHGPCTQDAQNSTGRERRDEDCERGQAEGHGRGPWGRTRS